MSAPFSDNELKPRIRWYIAVRWFFLLAIAGPSIASLIIRYGINAQVIQDAGILVVALGINCLMFVASSIKPPWRSYLRALAVSQVGFDLVLMSGAIFANGGIETPLAALYCLPLLMSSVLLSLRGVYGTGLAATILFVGMSLLDFAGVLQPANVAAPQLHQDANNLLPTLVGTATILLTVTAVAGFVGRFVRQRSELAGELAEVMLEKAKVDAIIKTMGSALVAIDTKGRITLVNENFEDLTGWERKEVVGKPLDEVLPMLDENGKRVPPDARPSLRLSSLETATRGIRAVDSYSYERKDGTTFPIVSRLAPIIVNNRMVGITNVFDDVTTTQELEQLKTNFVALVSHQLKTPIGEITGYVDNMIHGVTGKLSEKQATYLHRVQEACRRCTKLITDLLDITVLERGGLTLIIEPVPLQQVTAELQKIYQDRLDKKSLSLKFVEEAGPLTIMADKDKFTEALSNVVANAITYSQHGVITVKSDTRGRIAQISVSDHGRGMDKATLKALFAKDRVLSAAPTAEGGTGLGLYLAKQLIRLQKGDIVVATTSPKGTTITINMPLVKGQPWMTPTIV